MQILSRFTCYNENSTQVCSRNGKILPEDTYNEASAYSHSVQYMLNVFPDLQNLAECSMVKDAFSDVFLHQCRPFRTSLRWLWASMLSLSISMMLLELTWIVKAFQEKGRCFSRCSIFPRQSNPLQNSKTVWWRLSLGWLRCINLSHTIKFQYIFMIVLRHGKIIQAKITLD